MCGLRAQTLVLHLTAMEHRKATCLHRIVYTSANWGSSDNNIFKVSKFYGNFYGNCDHATNCVFYKW